MKVQIDIENSKTNDVISINANVIKYDNDSLSIFDISSLNESEKKLLEDAINAELTYTDIELFFIGEDNKPYFGPDYDYRIKGNRLYLNHKKIEYSKLEEDKNEDWTLYFEDEFKKLVTVFLNSKNDYLLIFYDNELKMNMYKDKPDDDIFMKMFFDNGYKAIALFRKNKRTNIENIRDNLEFINSYCEDDKIYEMRK